MEINPFRFGKKLQFIGHETSEGAMNITSLNGPLILHNRHVFIPPPAMNLHFLSSRGNQESRCGDDDRITIWRVEEDLMQFRFNLICSSGREGKSGNNPKNASGGQLNGREGGRKRGRERVLIEITPEALKEEMNMLIST